jgi:hypothetical protein
MTRTAPSAASASPLLEGAVAVPSLSLAATGHAGYGICRICRGPAASGRASCWSCRQVCAQLGGRATPVIPLFLFALGSPVHRTLVGYKAAATAGARSSRSHALETALAAYLDRHISCVTGFSSGRVVIVPVPSTVGGRPSWGGRHPIGPLAAAALEALGGSGGGGVDLRLAEALRAGPVPPRRLEARAAGFEVGRDGIEGGVAGATVVVLDDIFTSGARAQSAVAALARAGADVVAVVPFGRLVRPDHNSATAAFWADRSRSVWQPAVCAACRPARVASLAALARRRGPSVTTVRLAA